MHGLIDPLRTECLMPLYTQDGGVDDCFTSGLGDHMCANSAIFPVNTVKRGSWVYLHPQKLHMKDMVPHGYTALVNTQMETTNLQCKNTFWLGTKLLSMRQRSRSNLPHRSKANGVNGRTL